MWQRLLLWKIQQKTLSGALKTAKWHLISLRRLSSFYGSCNALSLKAVSFLVQQLYFVWWWLLSFETIGALQVGQITTSNFSHKQKDLHNWVSEMKKTLRQSFTSGNSSFHAVYFQLILLGSWLHVAQVLTTQAIVILSETFDHYLLEMTRLDNHHLVWPFTPRSEADCVLLRVNWNSWQVKGWQHNTQPKCHISIFFRKKPATMRFGFVWIYQAPHRARP